MPPRGWRGSYKPRQRNKEEYQGSPMTSKEAGFWRRYGESKKMSDPVRVIIDTRDGNTTFFMEQKEATKLYDEGKLAWQPANKMYCPTLKTPAFIIPGELYWDFREEQKWLEKLAGK